MRNLLFLLLLSFSLPTLQAGIFDSLFGGSKKADVRVEESPETVQEQEIDTFAEEAEEITPEKRVIVEEEVISADEYMDSSEERDDTIFEEQPAVPEESAVAADEEEHATAAAPQSESGSEEPDPFIRVRNILLSYTRTPEKIYLGQHFRIGISAIIPQTDITAIQTDFIGGRSWKLLNRDHPWVQTGENRYENSFILKLTAPDAKLPNIKVTNQSSDGTIKSEILKPFGTKVVALHKDELFSGVIADTLQVRNHQERPYDEHANIVVLEINATNANLEDFHIPYASREGIDDLKQNGDSQKIYYFAIVSNLKKAFKFKYFNPKLKRYEIVSFDIKPIDTSISTHTELNPQKNKYILYKALFLIAMALLFIALFIFYRRYLYLLFALVFIGLLFYVQIPITRTKLPSGTPLRILPVANSTIFFRTQQPLEVDILLKKRGYTKVLLPNKKIGWVKNEDIR